MHRIRRHRRAVSLLAAVLLAMQPLFALAAGVWAAGNPPDGALVICTQHGVMIVDADGKPLPGQPKKSGQCLCCAAGCTVPAALPQTGPLAGVLASPSATVMRSLVPDEPPLLRALSGTLAAAPRGPPARA